MRCRVRFAFSVANHVRLDGIYSEKVSQQLMLLLPVVFNVEVCHLNPLAVVIDVDLPLGYHTTFSNLYSFAVAHVLPS